MVSRDHLYFTFSHWANKSRFLIERHSEFESEIKIIINAKIATSFIVFVCASERNNCLSAWKLRHEMLDLHVRVRALMKSPSLRPALNCPW
jgi:hypothetical protein